jgi:hypothetical protein
MRLHEVGVGCGHAHRGEVADDHYDRAAGDVGIAASDHEGISPLSRLASLSTATSWRRMSN